MALEHVRTARPRVLYLALGETDDWAHAGRYDHYLHAAQRFDRFTQRLWETMQSMDQYRGQTTFVITTDHGRGGGPDGVEEPRREDPRSENIWIGVLGPGHACARRAGADGDGDPEPGGGDGGRGAGRRLRKRDGRSGTTDRGRARDEARASVEARMDRSRLLELLGATPASPPALAPAADRAGGPRRRRPREGHLCRRGGRARPRLRVPSRRRPAVIRPSSAITSTAASSRSARTARPASARHPISITRSSWPGGDT